MYWDLIICLPCELSRICCDIQMCFSKSDLDMFFPLKAFFLFAQSSAEFKRHPHPSKQPTFVHRYYSEQTFSVLLKDTSAGELTQGTCANAFHPHQRCFSDWETACNEQQSVEMKRQRAVSCGKKQCIDWLGYTFEPYFPHSKERASVQYLQTGLDSEKPLKSTDLECGYEKIQIFPREGTGDKQ